MIAVTVGRFILNALLLGILTALGLHWFGQTPVVLVLALGLAVKHATYIVLVGNIFQPLRTYLEDKREVAMRTTGWKAGFWRKPYVLVSCNLCASTHLSLWLVAFPAMVLWHYRQAHPLATALNIHLPASLEWLLTALATFLFSLVVGALAMAWWRVLEFPKEYAEAMKFVQSDKLRQQQKESLFAEDEER